MLPAVGVYAGSCWVLIEILDRLVERYLLSPYITDIAFWGLYSMIPAVTLIAWTHGKPGKDRTSTAEKVGVPINIIATLGLLLTIFGGKDLGATANMITVNNEQGIEETHYIPNESFRRRMTLFFFANESGDPGLDWLQYGVTELLVQDLRQNPFVAISSPWDNFGNGFYARMQQAGFEDGLGLPRSLMREIANDGNRQYFVEGSFDRISDEYQVTARIWDTKTLMLVVELTESGWDLYATVDALSLELREALDIPKSSTRIAQDLPLAETYGESQEAFKSFVAGLNARLFDNDIEASISHVEQALEADPGFVRAWFLQAINHLDSGDLPSSQAAISKAQQLDYRLPALDRARVKQVNYRLTGQTEKLIAFLRMQVRLRDDASSHNTLAVMLMATGEPEEAKTEFLEGLRKDTLNLAIYLQLAALERATGNMDEAISYARRYQQEKPEDVDVHLTLGDLLRDNGDLDAAQAHYQEAVLLENQPVRPMLKMADVAMRRGDANAGRKLLEQAEEIAQTSQDKALVRASASYIEYRLGRIYAAIEQLNRQEEFLRQSLPPFQLALTIYAPMVRYYCDLHDTDNAQTALDKGLAMVQPPLDQFLAFSEAAILLEMGDLEGAEAAVGKGIAIIDQFKLEHLRFQVNLLEGFISQKRGDHEDSAESFQIALDRIEHSVFGGADVYDVYRALPVLNAVLAESLLLGGDLDGAEKALDKGFEQDPSEPTLWASKARFQFASGLPQLALASVNYALAIWKDADPEYREYKQAVKLEADILEAL